MIILINLFLKKMKILLVFLIISYQIWLRSFLNEKIDVNEIIRAKSKAEINFPRAGS